MHPLTGRQRVSYDEVFRYPTMTGYRGCRLDAGPGTALRLGTVSEIGLPDAVAIAHLHSDHIYDLLPMGKLLLRRWIRRPDESTSLELDESVPQTPLFVPSGAAKLLQSLAGLFPVATPSVARSRLRRPWVRPGETVDVGHLSVRFELLRPAAPNCGIRVESARTSLVDTGDAGSGTGRLERRSPFRPTTEVRLPPMRTERLATSLDLGAIFETSVPLSGIQ